MHEHITLYTLDQCALQASQRCAVHTAASDLTQEVIVVQQVRQLDLANCNADLYDFCINSGGLVCPATAPDMTEGSLAVQEIDMFVCFVQASCFASPCVRACVRVCVGQS